ncbi:MAG TPA: hypothetical protein VGS22_04635 [Thermoanaerobaculia bacterium]|nr:hypothetical protein [Thermoanaerobaculia bacterium]
MKTDRFCRHLVAGLMLSLLSVAPRVGASELASIPNPESIAASAVEWRPLPLEGADVRALAIAPGHPDLLFAGTSAGQVYRSNDGGANWIPAGAALPFPGWVVSSLRFEAAGSEAKSGAPPRLWVSLWGIWSGGHVASSDDLGVTWASRSGGLPNLQVYAVAPVPGEEGRLYAATAQGVWGTLDAGKSWHYLTAALPEIGKVTSLLVDPRRPGTIFAGTWRQAYRSDDGGTTWRGVFDGMVLDSEVFTLTPGWEEGEIWASTCGWVYQTLNGGGSWKRYQQGLGERRTPSFAVLPDGRLLAGTVAGAYFSTDGGATWKLGSDPALSVLAVAADPGRPERIVLGTEGSGIWISSSAGSEGFHPANRGLTNLRIGGLATMPGKPDDPSDPGELWVAVNHAGPSSGIYRSADGGRTFFDFFQLPTVLGLAVDGERGFAATERGLYERRGESWVRRPELGEKRIDEVARTGSRTLARTADGLFELRRSTKGKESFEPVKLPAGGTPQSAVLWSGALWGSDPTSVFRFEEGLRTAIPTPFPGGRVERSSAGLLYSGSGGVFLRTAPAQEWTELAKGPARVIPTGDEQLTAVIVTADAAYLLDRGQTHLRPLSLPFPARDLTAARMFEGRLLLGTSGYGVQAAAP